jgi:4'-phosphopantetheinyl transferase
LGWTRPTPAFARPDRAKMRQSGRLMASGSARADLTTPAPQVEVFVITTTHGADKAATLLSPVEAVTAARFRCPADQARFAVSHAALRTILSRKLGIAPLDIAFDLGPNGKPGVTGVEFNLAHSGDLAVVAIGQVPLGIDIERIMPLDANHLALHHFSDVERCSLANLGSAQVLDGFFDIWTRKEAFLKATEDGLSRRLDQFDVSLDANAALLATRPDPTEAQAWCLTALDIQAGYAAALCTKGQSPARVTVRRFRFEGDCAQA